MGDGVGFLEGFSDFDEIFFFGVDGEVLGFWGVLIVFGSEFYDFEFFFVDVGVLIGLDFDNSSVLEHP